MNSKRNKKNVNDVDVVEDDSNVHKKTKKKKTEVTNENANTENKSKKRKLLSVEEVSVPPKKAKKKLKSITALENNTELHVTEDNTEIVPSTKNSKRKNNASKTFSAESATLDNNAEPEIVTKTGKKGKKKRKINSEDEFENMKNETDAVDTNPGEGVSHTKYANNSKMSNDTIMIKNGTGEVINSTKQILHHEVNIIDIKTENVNEDNENVVTISIRDVENMDSDWDENDLLKQLEKRVEKKDVPKEKRFCIDWPDVDLMELVERMEVGIPENDLKPFMKRSDELEWDKIAFKNYTIEDCKKTWLYMLKKIRKYRILKEVLEDTKKWITTAKVKKKAPKVQRHPDMPRRPLSAYFLFYLKEKDVLQIEHPGTDATELAKHCAHKFKLLPAEKLLKYEKLAKKNKEEYDQKLKAFYELHPEFKVTKEPKPKKIKSPKPVKEKPPPKPKILKEKFPKRPLSAFQYYHNTELSKKPIEDQDKASFKEINREKWKEMPDDKKMEWITYAEAETVRYEEEMREYAKNHPDYISNEKKPQLTKEDLLVKERMSGKPQKPPVSAYNLFARLMLHSDDIKEVPVKERLVFASNQWKKCTDEDKKHYKELFEKEIEKYNQDFAAYLESLPEADRKLELLKAHPKRRKSEDEKSKKESKSKKVVKKKIEPKPEKKKINNKTTEKKAEKAKDKTRKLVEPEQPPISPCKYFASLYKGEGSALKVWKTLNTEEKKKYEDELVQKKRAYILDFEKFLKSMTKEELENFSNSRKKLNNQKHDEEEEGEEEEDDDEETSDSEDNSEDESGEEN